MHNRNIALLIFARFAGSAMPNFSPPVWFPETQVAFQDLKFGFRNLNIPVQMPATNLGCREPKRCHLNGKPSGFRKPIESSIEGSIGGKISDLFYLLGFVMFLLICMV